MNIDRSYRIGRCNHCTNRPAYAWKASTGLRLDDVECPRCGRGLDRTSREAHYMRTLTDDEVVTQRLAAIERTVDRVIGHVRMVAAWRVDLEAAATDADRFRCQLNLESYERAEKAARADLARLGKAQKAQTPA